MIHAYGIAFKGYTLVTRGSQREPLILSSRPPEAEEVDQVNGKCDEDLVEVAFEWTSS